MTVQAQNDTNSDDDLTSIQDEIGQRLNEIDRITGQTDFNGTKVLASDNALKIQVGADDGQQIEVNVKEINAETLGLTGFNVDGTGTPNDAAVEEDLAANAFIDQNDGTFENATFNREGTANDAISRVEDKDELTAGGTTYTFDEGLDAFTFDETDRGVGAAGVDLADRLTPEGDETNSLTVTGNESVDVIVDSNGDIARADDPDGDLFFNTSTGNFNNTKSSADDVAANIDDVVEYVATDGSTNDITIDDGTTTFSPSSAATDDTVDVANDTITRTELEAQISNNSSDFSVVDENSNARFDYVDSTDTLTTNGAAANEIFVSGFDNETLIVDGTNGAKQSIKAQGDGTFTSVLDGEQQQVFVTEDGDLSLDAVKDRTATEDPLATLDSALNDVDSLRSELGAVQNRFESAITNLNTNEINLSAARSRIEDADYAAEVAAQTKNQILQQAGTSTLAQANQIPQNVLSLLG